MSPIFYATQAKTLLHCHEQLDLLMVPWSAKTSYTSSQPSFVSRGACGFENHLQMNEEYASVRGLVP